MRKLAIAAGFIGAAVLGGCVDSSQIADSPASQATVEQDAHYFVRMGATGVTGVAEFTPATAPNMTCVAVTEAGVDCFPKDQGTAPITPAP